ncbi:general transcription factor IIF subunit 2-like [Littorina saxatilis]|uniref:General transcription factor IIF subunit 2 n=1 Tax=Littorina saxatilis TaxID=31220 RepID=A0AAN9G007_9CAEN
MSQGASAEAKAQEARDVDVTAAGRGVWLVKVPKYLSERWEKLQGNGDVGKLRITRSNSKMGPQKPDVVFTSTDAVMNQPGTAPSIPRTHKFALTGVSNQNLVVFSQPHGSEQITIEGKVIQRAECHPVADDKYMQLKRKQLEINNKPKREIVLLQSVVPMYKPRSDHISNIEEKKRNKDTEKRSRLDKEKVMDMLFAAFEKHQYYNVKDLVGITKQPIPYLKEILQEICVYNMKAPHKNMWELKPEFRHYKQSETS